MSRAEFVLCSLIFLAVAWQGAVSMPVVELCFDHEDVHHSQYDKTA